MFKHENNLIFKQQIIKEIKNKNLQNQNVDWRLLFKKSGYI